MVPAMRTDPSGRIPFLRDLVSASSLLSTGDLQAVLVNNPKVAAAVAEICMVGLATTAQATKGPPKPDKARIDRLAYVVSECLPAFCTFNVRSQVTSLPYCSKP